MHALLKSAASAIRKMSSFEKNIAFSDADINRVLKSLDLDAGPLSALQIQTLDGGLTVSGKYCVAGTTLMIGQDLALADFRCDREHQHLHLRPVGLCRVVGISAYARVVAALIGQVLRGRLAGFILSRSLRSIRCVSVDNGLVKVNLASAGIIDWLSGWIKKQDSYFEQKKILGNLGVSLLKSGEIQNFEIKQGEVRARMSINII